MAPRDVSTVFDPAGVEFRPVSPALIKARFIVNGFWYIPLLIAGIVLAMWWTPKIWIVVALIVLTTLWALWLIPRQVRAIGYAETESDLIIRRGVMIRSMSIVPYGRMQYVDVTEGPIARACGIASIQLHTASMATDASIDGLVPAEAARLRDRLTAKGEANLAGL